MEKKTNKTKGHEIFGSFFIRESEYALPITRVQEVVNAPETYTCLPLAPSFLKGLFNLRGRIIPVVDLRILLKLSLPSAEGTQKVAIIELDGSCIGLLFDRTGEIFKSHEEERCDFEDPSDQTVISGVFKKDHGKRIIQILDTPKLIQMRGIPREGKDQYSNTRERFTGNRGNRKQCISFVVGPARCALEISDIQEIIKIEKLSESALAYGSCLGIVNLRGQTIPIIDFSALLKYRETDRSIDATQGDRRIIIMRIEKELFGLLVDSVESIVSYFSDEVLQFPVLNQDRAEMFKGCISSKEKLEILLLDHQKILSSSEILEITHGHSDLYQVRVEETQKQKMTNTQRNTYVTFVIENIYAVNIKEVKEVIEYPEKLMQPPGLPNHFKGVLNLRGELVTIIDGRTLYSVNPSDSMIRKVLIFKKNDFHFGLVVDSVESILSIMESEKIKLPPLLYQEHHLTEDIGEAVEIFSGTDKRRSLLILNSELLTERVKRKSVA